MSYSLRRSRIGAITAALVVSAGLVTANVASASHPEVSLSGSNFEIEPNANLKLDDAAPSEDWASVTQTRKTDKASGGGDDAFGQGSKEDTAVPAVVDGTIPPNKSDLKHFGVYQEGSSNAGFLHLYWSRVQDPQGTTNMDFEFNQSQTTSGNDVTPVRTLGDLLITYDLTQGGSTAVMGKRTWTTSGWSDYTPFGTDAVGTINTSSIPAADADSPTLGAHSARTFGEASIRMSSIIPPGTCTTFGSAYLKSRSSDSFTAALKDFIAPVAVNISNCGSIKVIKTGGGAPLNGAEFTLYRDLAPLGGTRNDGGVTDPITNPVLKCETAGTGADAGTCVISNVPLGNYWLHETKVPQGYVAAPDQTVIVSGDSQVERTFDNPVAVIDTTLTTEQRWLPNHQASLSVPAGQGDLAGTVTFTLYENGSCDDDPNVTEPTWTRNVATQSIDNDDNPLTSTVRTSNTTVYTDSQSVSWGVDFVSTNIHHNNSANICDKSSWTLTNNYPPPGP